MSNGDLETRVTDLEALVNLLIANLADNNTRFLDTLDVLADTSLSTGTRQDAVDSARSGICTTNPPGCNV